MTAKQSQLTSNQVATILSTFAGERNEHTQYPFQSDTHLYSTNAKTAISISKQLTGDISSIEFDSGAEIVSVLASLFKTNADKHITIKQTTIYNDILDSIIDGNKAYNEAVTRFTLDDWYGQCIKFETNSLKYFKDTFSVLQGHNESSEVRLLKNSNHYISYTIAPNVLQHVYFKTSELIKILKLFKNEQKFSISFKDRANKIVFSNFDDTIKAVTMPYSVH